ncbi:MAG TPA: radical SAM family heme chaperone HemW [Thermomicrobiales bacterium]|nr:radical SAM family heme chaperone HemW [Thermomicrobiales bacterium]
MPDSIQVTALPVPMPADAPPGLYVHVPFCRHICPYCDFNTYAGQDQLIPDYVAAVIEEMGIEETERRTTGAPTLFFGGGTPSLLTPAQVGDIVAAARDLFGLRVDAEVTLESNPESLDAEYLSRLREAGVNRLSIGVQSQQRAGLRVLGRGHTAQKAESAIQAAREAGFDNISLDFIFGWPGQTDEDWQADLDQILRWQPEHVSLYSLIVEPGTPMHAAVDRGILRALDDDTAAVMYELAADLLADAGWEHYEIANWAREPRYRSRHNQLYWQAGPYHGFGAGAHGTIDGVRYSNLLLPSKYIAAVREGRRPLAVSETLATETAMGETMMLGLRLLVDGVSSTDFAARHSQSLTDRYAGEIERFTSIGLLEWHTPDRLRLTERGALLANDVSAAFLP